MGACDLRRYSPLVGVGGDEVGDEVDGLDKMVAVVWVSRRRAGRKIERLRNQQRSPVTPATDETDAASSGRQNGGSKRWREKRTVSSSASASSASTTGSAVLQCDSNCKCSDYSSAIASAATILQPRR